MYKRQDRVSADEVIVLEISDVPESVMSTVSIKEPSFVPKEVVKKIRDGRVYYDVEGALPNGSEIEFDVLMTDKGPEIVEIQRDLLWESVPQAAQDLVNSANKDKLEVVRVIESQQTDDSIIYEVFVAGKSSDPYFEVRVDRQGAELLEARWKH